MLIESFNMNPLDVFFSLYSEPHPFLLDSCGLGRYSFAGANPFISIKTQNGKTQIIYGSTDKVTTDDTFSVINALLNEFKVAQTNPKSAPGGNIPFHGGAVGYLGYELKSQLECLPKRKDTRLNVPDCLLGLYDTIFAYDHKTNKGYVIASGLPEKKNGIKKLLAKERINRFLGIIKASPKYPCSAVASSKKPLPQCKTSKIKIKSNFTKNGYINAIKRVQDYIASGDIYQANISQRLVVDFQENPLPFYSRLRQINSAPFGAFLNYGDFQVISNSPERLLKVRCDVAETSPIKGTISRGKNSKNDKILIKELKTSVKESAEHIMVVDLERNDMGKICKYGTIKVWPQQKIYTYPTLHHMVSTVSGMVKNGITLVDCVKALFPGGSVTGAPKVRAMEIIEEMEPTPRGVYTGAIGYIDFRGNMDLSMAIRTAVLKDKKLYLNVGGGIVADSNPEGEYEETMLKANAFLKALKE